MRVVLPDYQGWWAPLTHLFYSSTSRCLASAHPSSTREEIESYYCPSCLGYLAEAEAAAAGHRCPRCFDCPRCPPGGAAALVVVPAAGAGGGKGGWELRCGFCGWASGGELGLVEEDPEFLGMTLSVAERESGEEKRVGGGGGGGGGCVCVCVLSGWVGGCMVCEGAPASSHHHHLFPAVHDMI